MDQKISIHPDATVFDDTNLSEEEIISEVEYLLGADLITYIEPNEEVPEFKQHRLTKQGFQMIHEQKQAERQLEWRKSSRYSNWILTFATIILAFTSIFQVFRIQIDIRQLIQLGLFGFFIIVIGTNIMK